MFIQEENLENPDKEKYDKVKEPEFDFLNNQEITPYFPNKPEILIKDKTNNIDSNRPENITLEEIKKIMEGPKLCLEETDNIEDMYFTKNSKTELQTTYSSTRNLFLFENKEEKFNKNMYFTTILRKKRGRSVKENPNKKKQKCHSSDDFDNIQRKIQVHYISFLIWLGNDAIKTIFGQKTKYHFKQVNYEFKKIVNHNYIEYLKKCKYSDIMQMTISPKNKRFKEDSNKKTFLEVCKYSEILKNIFDKNYLYIFQKYYCGLESNKNILDLEGLKITLSSKTKALFNLLNKNETNKEKFKNVIKDVYFSDIIYNNDKKFFISSFSWVDKKEKKIKKI